jgi:D-alanyl-D-alanine carboxypeptidase/D-alanyl-D-alanine-endopeptidase (penicillin-binding protein 4)
MLDLISSGLVGFWLGVAGIRPEASAAWELLALQSTPALVLAPAPDSVAMTTVQKYLQELETKELGRTHQGVWIQSGPLLLSENNGRVPLPAASLTKIATSLAALKTWGANHQFETLISATGPIQNGVLQGDLIVTGGGDPLFVWQEAIALGNSLNQLGISRVTGNLVVTGNFAMNYQSDSLKAGELLKQGLDSTTWKAAAKMQYSTLPPGTPKPRVAIAGRVQVAAIPNPKQILLLRHHSLPLSQILKEMNVYSNNEMAEMLGQLLGGAPIVRQIAATTAGVPESEILLSNTSGLGMENQISPRAVCAMFMAVQRELLPDQLSVADLFPVSGRDRRGTLELRHVPAGAVVKTGTLNEVSALAGVLPTRDRGLVWFVIINRGWQIESLRAGQDKFLQNLLHQWHAFPAIPTAIVPRAIGTTSMPLGASSRNEVLYRS